MLFFLLFLLFISLFLEGTVTALPLVFVCLLCLTILMRNPFVFSLAFLTGVLLDAFALRPIGGTSIFFLVSILLVLLYQRKYEINTYPFVFIASFIGSIVYLIVFGYQAVIVQAGISSVFSVLIYSVSRMTSRQTQNANLQFKAL